jgi:SAM-dependent methyltransferase
VSLHEDRARANSFGEDAEQYDRSRPSYPVELVDDLVSADTHAVLDVGCGTGIASRLFIARGCALVAVEQDARMAAVARRTGVDVDVATFETWTPRGAPFDLLISAQAWHWVDPAIGPAKAAAVLRAGGRFAAFWNLSAHEAAFRDALTDVYSRHAPELVGRSTALGTLPSEWSAPLDAGTLGDASGFAHIEWRTYPWRHTYSRDEWLDQLPTHSDHRLLPPPTLAALLADVGAAVDAQGGHLTVDYTTGVLTALKV